MWGIVLLWGMLLLRLGRLWGLLIVLRLIASRLLGVLGLHVRGVLLGSRWGVLLRLLPVPMRVSGQAHACTHGVNVDELQSR